MADLTNLSSFGFQGNSKNDFTNSEEMSQFLRYKVTLKKLRVILKEEYLELYRSYKKSNLNVSFCHVRVRLLGIYVNQQQL